MEDRAERGFSGLDARRANSSPEDSLQPKPNITRLNFNPPLYDMLAPRTPHFLALLPRRSPPLDRSSFDSMTVGVRLRDRHLPMARAHLQLRVVKELPCFKPPSETGFAPRSATDPISHDRVAPGGCSSTGATRLEVIRSNMTANHRILISYRVVAR